MKKAIYGLFDASRLWCIKVNEEMTKLGGKTLVGDKSLVYFCDNGRCIGLITLQVDDFQEAGTEGFLRMCSKHLLRSSRLAK